MQVADIVCASIQLKTQGYYITGDIYTVDVGGSSPSSPTHYFLVKYRDTMRALIPDPLFPITRPVLLTQRI